MGKLEQAKTVYESIEIPKELGERVNQTIEKSRILHEHQKGQKSAKTGRRVLSGTVTAAAVAAAVLVAGLNTSSTFAAAAKDIPIFGKVAEVLTFRTYETVDEDKTVYGNLPGVTIENATVEEQDFSAEVNALIQEKCDAYIGEAVTRVYEYKDAFIATGGTEEEFARKEIVIQVNYEILSQSEDTVSFVVRGTENWVSAYAMTDYYNLDLKGLRYLTLEDVLGADYINIANKSIKEQMQQREEEDSNQIFWTAEEGGFESIDENTRFYINDQNQPVIVFDKYEVAPGAMGMVEFVIAQQ